MRVFVLGTGRCGTVTFSKAGQHFSNYTCSHESKSQKNDLVYADGHIEVDPHLFWHLPNLIEKYTDAMFVHLDRNKHACVKSLGKRNSTRLYAKFTEMVGDNMYNPIEISSKYYDFCNKTISLVLKQTGVRSIRMTTPISEESWRIFCKEIGEEESFLKSFEELTKVYNRS
jgi:hypothetical protein